MIARNERALLDAIAAMRGESHARDIFARVGGVAVDKVVQAEREKKAVRSIMEPHMTAAARLIWC